MSQNRTIIPGVDYSQYEDDADQFYSRSNKANTNRTYVPDMYREMSRELEEDNPDTSFQRNEEERMIAGVLFSISRKPSGEVFPIYLGRNSIGSDDACDVCLKEETVSPNHALLLIRSLEKGDTDYTVTLTDFRSYYGTKVGTTVLNDERQVCSNHDILTIGENYQLMLCLFDVKKYNLKTASYFRNILSKPKESNKEIQREPATVQTTRQMENVEDEMDFYAPTKTSGGNHSTNKTIVM